MFSSRSGNKDWWGWTKSCCLLGRSTEQNGRLSESSSKMKMERMALLGTGRKSNEYAGGWMRSAPRTPSPPNKVVWQNNMSLSQLIVLSMTLEWFFKREILYYNNLFHAWNMTITIIRKQFVQNLLNWISYSLRFNHCNNNIQNWEIIYTQFLW